MEITEKIVRHIQALPEAKQAEVLDFVEFLRTKLALQEDSEWSGFSISSALRGMEQDPSPYSLDDLKETFT